MRVVIGDDSALIREGISGLLRAHGYDVVATADDAETLVSVVTELRPDVAVVDIRMPPTHTTEGLQAARTIREQAPGVGILLLSQGVHAGQALGLFRDSGSGLGYLLKDRVSDVADFTAAIDQVARGGSVLDPIVVEALVSASTAAGALQDLTPREAEVLGLMAEGRSNISVAETLHLSPKTVETYVGSIFSKLMLEGSSDTSRRVLAVLAYLRVHS
jgi:DNA-binding NarL/FixJ family response regulator